MSDATPATVALRLLADALATMEPVLTAAEAAGDPRADEIRAIVATLRARLEEWRKRDE